MRLNSALLEKYIILYPEEAETVNRVRHLLETQPDAFHRTCRIGHITGSAWIVSANRQRYLLTHHRQLDRWLQLGGHADGEQAVGQVALREAQEESGMTDFTIIKIKGQEMPFDIDIHPIPARGAEPAHDHYDLRYLLIAGPGQPLRISHESKDLGWFTAEEVLRMTDEVGIRRMLRKAEKLL